MRLTLEPTDGVNLVRGWEPGALRVNERLVTGTVLVSADALMQIDITTPDDLDSDTLAPAFELHPSVLLIGTGARQRFPAPATMHAFLAAGIGVEVMDTIAAARTYNVLVGEGRDVVAVLLPPDA